MGFPPLLHVCNPKMPPFEVHRPQGDIEEPPFTQWPFIGDCPMLQSLPEGGLPTSLTYLKIQKCPMLTERCQKEGGGGPDWPKIAHIRKLYID
ncbi:hypothetical protein SLA2020_429020 [Shorea laevis]